MKKNNNYSLAWSTTPTQLCRSSLYEGLQRSLKLSFPLELLRLECSIVDSIMVIGQAALINSPTFKSKLFIIYVRDFFCLFKLLLNKAKKVCHSLVIEDKCLWLSKIQRQPICEEKIYRLEDVGTLRKSQLFKA